MNHFNMTYDEVVNSPMQRLVMLAKGMPKFKPEEKKKKKPGLLDFVKDNNLLKKKK